MSSKNDKRTAAIMQPTYLPWIGYFDIMDQVDVFVILDSAQFSRRSWQQRNRIKTATGELMLTVPILTKGRREQCIDDALIDASSHFEVSHLSSIRGSYARASFFADEWLPLSRILESVPKRLVDLNLALIDHFKDALGIGVDVVRSSTLLASGHKVDLLVDICERVGAERYLSPLGSKAYIDENNIFASRGIDLVYHNYRHPTYRQLHGEFLPYMSVVDLLFNEGASASLPMIRSGRLDAILGN